ncbi:MAG TPA: Xaa-Pro peptidase family protein [Burkholderiales bacterium]|nr:Xaa-Pro peptidase family protein [Burkholderiales bacterium]
MKHTVLDEPEIAAILAQPFGRFSDQEFARRRRALTEVTLKHGCDAVVLCGEQRAGSGVYWLTGWPTSSEAMVVFAPDERDVLFIEFHNHVPNARRLARDADVRWAERRGAQKAAEELARRGAKRVGVVGLLSWRKARQLAQTFELVDLAHEYQWLRMRKSDEEIRWMRIGAAFSDLGLETLLREAKVGMTERELGALVESGYHPLGGSTVIHFIGVNDMTRPDTCVPPQHHSSRRVRAGDMLFVEFSGTFWDYPGQVLRTIAIGAEPTPLFRSLYDTADAAFSAITGVLRAGATAEELVQASRVIEEAGFSIYDDVVHGFGGGYWPPVLGAQSRAPGCIPDLRLESNMTLVVQPNVITRDESAGVQLGEMVRVTASGFERMHSAPWGFLRIG